MPRLPNEVAPEPGAPDAKLAGLGLAPWIAINGAVAGLVTGKVRVC